MTGSWRCEKPELNPFRFGAGPLVGAEGRLKDVACQVLRLRRIARTREAIGVHLAAVQRKDLGEIEQRHGPDCMGDQITQEETPDRPKCDRPNPVTFGHLRCFPCI
jgi:hypothetical protein